MLTLKILLPLQVLKKMEPEVEIKHLNHLVQDLEVELPQTMVVLLQLVLEPVPQLLKEITVLD